jgi:hypothetical protein
MIHYNKISLTEFGHMAEDIRRIADRVASGNLMAVGIVICDNECRAIDTSCIIDADFGTPELIDAMADYLKAHLFDIYEDGQEDSSGPVPSIGET